MLHALSALMQFTAPRMVPAEEIPWSKMIFEIILAALLLTLAFLFRTRFLKILFSCGTEICLFLVCRSVFGPDSIITQIMCWVTAAVACLMTVSIVSRINWGSLRGNPDR